MGIWGTLGKIGVGLGSMIPGIGPIIGTVGSALAGRGGAPKPGFDINTTSQAGTAADRARVTAAGDRMTGLSQFGEEQSRGLLGGAANNLTGASDYYTSLASGDPAKLMEALQPEMAMSQQNQKNALAAIQRGPQGGGFQQAGRMSRIAGASDRTRLMGEGRARGVAGQERVGAERGRLGLGAGDLAARTGSEAGRLSLSQMNADTNQQNMQNRVMVEQAKLGSAERSGNIGLGAAAGANAAQQGGLGGLLKKIPFLNKIPGINKLAGFLGQNEQPTIPSGSFPATAGPAPDMSIPSTDLSGGSMFSGGGSQANGFSNPSLGGTSKQFQGYRKNAF